VTLVAGRPDEIEDLLAPHLPPGTAILGVDRTPSPNRSSFLVDDVSVRLDDGATMALVAKAVQWDALEDEGRRAKPRFLWDPEREPATYEAILADADLDTPRCLGSYTATSGIRYLVLERVDGIPLWQCERFEAWRAAAKWLARLHRVVGVERARQSNAGPHLLAYTRPLYDQWISRARAFHPGHGDAMQALAVRHEVVVNRLLALPETFIHGEFYPSNVLIARGDGNADPDPVVRPVDWEMTAIGPALMDLGCLLAGRWTDDERADIADVYFAELAAHRGAVPSRQQYLMDLDFCLVHLSIRNLGWSRDWVPPADRAHDWLGDALRICEKWQL
jgi:hypothetical protein